MLISEIIGDFGRYQACLCFIVFLSKFGIGYHQMAIIFFAPPVNYTCKDIPKDNGSCCDHPIYDKSIFTRTIVTEWNLICDKSWLKDLTQTVFQFGVLVGSLLFGIASDRFGRRPALITAGVIEILTGIMATFLPDFWSFTLVRMILGMAVGGVMVIGFVMCMEYVGQRYRESVSALYQICFTMGHVILALIGYFIRDYVHFQLCISMLTVVQLIYICFLPESPRWLLAKNKVFKACALMEQIARINKKDVDLTKQKIETYILQFHDSSTRKGTVFDLFRTPNIRKNILVMSFNWLITSYCFYGVAQYISFISGNIFINVAACGGVCCLSCLIVIPLMKTTGRRPLMIYINVACGLCLILIAVIPEGIASVILACLGSLFSFMTFIIAYLYCSEMFPTVVRNAAIGISSMMARIGSMIAPFVTALKPYGNWCAPVAFGILPLVAGLLCILLPETKNCELMVTIEEGEAFGKKLPSNVEHDKDGIGTSETKYKNMTKS